MKRHLRAGLALVALLPAAVRGQEAPAPEVELTLEEAITRAVEFSPTVVQAEGDVLTAGSTERRVFGTYLPSLTLTSNASTTSSERFNPQTQTAVTGSDQSYSAAVSSSVTLFDAGRGADRWSARATTEAARATLVDRRYAIALTAAQTFFEVLRAGELLRVARSSIQRAQQGLGAAERRLQAGSATRSDVLRARLDLADARLAEADAIAQRHAASYALGRLVGVEGPAGAVPTGEPAPRPLAIDRTEIVRLATESPTVRAAEADVVARSADVRAARGDYIPTLRLSGNTNWYNDQLALDGGSDSWSLQLGLTFPVFDGFQREDAIARAKVAENVARASLDDTHRLARAEVERLLAAIDLAERRIELAGEAVEVATEDLRVQNERYRLGASTIIDLVTSQFNLTNAEQALVTARFDYEIARAALSALVGRRV